MKAKNQHYTSEVEAKDKLIIFVYEYLIHSGAKAAADKFIESIGYNKTIEIKEGPGFLLEWWCVFWDLYCATPERRHLQPESSSDARAFHDFMRTPMSPSIAQTSPPQQHPMPQFMAGGPRHHGPPQHHPRGPPPRIQGPPPPHQHPVGPPGPPGGFMTTPSQRYGQHSGPPPQQTHMNQGGPPPPQMGYGPGPDQMGPSPVMNRMTNVGGPPQQMVGPPGSGGPPMVGIPSNQQLGGPPPPPPNQGPSQVNPMQSAGPPPRTGSQGGWHGNFNVNSPADQQCFMPPGPTNSGQPSQEFGGIIMSDNPGMMDMKSAPSVNSNNNNNNGNANNASNNNNNNGPPSNQAQQQPQQQDEYVMPGAYGQQVGDQGGDVGSEIRMLKESLESDANEGDQSGFNMDYAEAQGKW